MESFKSENNVKISIDNFAYIMWIISLMFLSFQFILRLWPGLIMTDFMQDLQLNTQQFGIIASFYYWGYALAQIPIAILLDKFNPKYILSTCAFLCGLAMIVFSATNNFYIACITRCIIGITSASGALGVSKIISIWFPKVSYDKILGISFSIGLVGAFYGGNPVSVLLQDVAYQDLGTYFGYIAIFISFIILCFLKQNTNSNSNLEPFEVSNVDNKDISTTNKYNIKDYIRLLFGKEIIVLGLVNLLLVGVLEGLSDVWGIEFLMQFFSLDKQDSALLISYIFIGLMLGFPILTYLSEKINVYNIIIFCGLSMGLLLFSLIKFEYNQILFTIIFMLLGFCSAYQANILCIGAKLSRVHSTVIFAFLNCLNMLGGSFFHIVIGYLITALLENGFSTIDSYVYGLSIIPICAIIGASLIFLIYKKN